MGDWQWRDRTPVLSGWLCYRLAGLASVRRERPSPMLRGWFFFSLPPCGGGLGWGVETPCPPTLSLPHKGGGNGGGVVPTLYILLALPPLGTTPPWERGAFPEPRTKRSGVSGAFPEPRTERSGVSGAAKATYSAYAACVALSSAPKRGVVPNLYIPLALPSFGTTLHPNPPPQGGREWRGG